MKNKKAYLFGFSALVAIAASLGAVACSTSTTADDTPTPGTDSGTNKDSTVSTKDGGTTPDQDADFGCPDAAAKLDLKPREAGAGVYCPFSADAGFTDAGVQKTKGAFCAPGEVCYKAPDPNAAGGVFGTTKCQATVLDTDAGEVNWECNGNADCAGKAGKSCCGLAKLGTDNNCPAFNGYVNGKFYKGTRCQAACNVANNEFKICETASDCPTNVCTPFSKNGSILGGCLP